MILAPRNGRLDGRAYIRGHAHGWFALGELATAGDRRGVWHHQGLAAREDDVPIADSSPSPNESTARRPLRHTKNRGTIWQARAFARLSGSYPGIFPLKR